MCLSPRRGESRDRHGSTSKKRPPELSLKFIFYSSDPPDVSLDGTTIPTVEYTIRTITCKVNGGNPSDPRSYTYKWLHRPIYGDTYIPLRHGMCLTSCALTIWVLSLRSCV